MRVPVAPGAQRPLGLRPHPRPLPGPPGHPPAAALPSYSSPARRPGTCGGLLLRDEDVPPAAGGDLDDDPGDPGDDPGDPGDDPGDLVAGRPDGPAARERD